MPFFKKKPVIIEAKRFSCRTLDNQEKLADWCHGSLRGTKLPPEEREIEIHTLEGDMRASFGDWIIRGVQGEYYPCKPAIFEETYESL